MAMMITTMGSDSACDHRQGPGSDFPLCVYVCVCVCMFPLPCPRRAVPRATQIRPDKTSPNAMHRIANGWMDGNDH